MICLISIHPGCIEISRFLQHSDMFTENHHPSPARRFSGDPLKLLWKTRSISKTPCFRCSFDTFRVCIWELHAHMDSESIERDLFLILSDTFSHSSGLQPIVQSPKCIETPLICRCFDTLITYHQRTSGDNGTESIERLPFYAFFDTSPCCSGTSLPPQSVMPLHPSGYFQSSCLHRLHNCHIT